MNTKPFENRKDSRAYSIMISDTIPENSVNLAYVHSPKINSKNTIISKEQVFSSDVLNENMYSLYYPFYDIEKENNIKRLQTITSHYTLNNNNLLITDEFTLKEYSKDVCSPLYYYHNLEFKIRANDSRNIYKESIPYTFGYEERTKQELELKLKNSTDKEDILPLIDVLTIYDSSGVVVNPSRYKVRMILDEDEFNDKLYSVILYHNFNSDETYKISYINSDNETINEIVKNNTLSHKASSLLELRNSNMNDKLYYINDTKDGYEVYVKNEIYRVDDNVREAFDFRYKMLANIDCRFTKDNEAMMKIGFINFDGAISLEEENDPSRGDSKNFLVSLVSESDTTFPSYIKFYNPYPPSGYGKNNPHLSNDPAIQKLLFDEKYWQTSLSYPQEHINEYDLIIITGYGEHSIPAYKDRVKNYLKQGGKILIDNSTNNSYNLFNLNFEDDSFFSYDYKRDQDLNPVLITNSKEWFNKNNKEYTRYYDLNKNFNVDEIGYIEGSNKVSAMFDVNTHTDRQWTDIVRYNGGYKCVGYYTYIEDDISRGRIYMSGIGLLKEYTYSNRTDTKKVLTNLIITILEDVWMNTPYHYERVYHIDQLYNQELTMMGYIQAAEDEGLVAKRKILDNPRNTISSFSELNLYNYSAVYYFDVQEFLMNNLTRNKEWQKSKNIILPYSVTDNESVYAYTNTPGRNDFDINSKDGYSDLNIKVYHEDVSFRYTIRPFCYKWSDTLIEDLLYSGTGVYYIGYPMINSSVKVYKVNPTSSVLLNKNSYTINNKNNTITLNANSNMTNSDYLKVEYRTSQIIQEKIYASTYTENEFLVSSGDGVLEIDKLSVLLPPIPNDEGFNDRDNVFYEVEVAKTGVNGLLDRSEDRINLFIYDKKEGRHLFNADGKSVISYNDMNKMEYVESDSDKNIYRYKTDDYYLIASTKYYLIALSKKVFGIEIEEEKDIDIKLLQNYNTDECWFPRIKNIDYTKKSFNKDDYVRWEKMFGFKFEKEYIISRLMELFAGHKDADIESINDNIIKNIVKKLNDNEVLEEEDIKVISEFFNVISSENLKLEYNLVEYERQAFNPNMPIKKIIGEKTRYIDKFTIGLSYENIVQGKYLNNNEVTRDVLERISSTKLKLNHDYVLYGYGNTFTLEIYDLSLNLYTEIDPDDYIVNYKNGIVEFKDPSLLTEIYKDMNIYATYKYSQIQILKRTNKPTNRTKAVLKKMDNNYWAAPDGYIIGSSKIVQGESKGIYLNPILYVKRKSQSILRKLDVVEYDVDYNRGLFKLKVDYDEAFYNIYADYSYVDHDWLEIDDIDEATGVVTLSSNNPITFRDTIIANYYYEDKYIDYSGYIDIDRHGVRRYIRLDLNPSRGHVCTIRQPLSDGETSNKWIDVPTSELVGQTVYFYILPKRVIKNEQIIRTNDITLKHTYDFNELKLIQLQYPEIMYIGSVKLTNNYTRYDVEVMDSRKRGGGLSESYTKDYIASVDESSLSYWDISPIDGDGFKSNGIVVIKLPSYILETFTQEEVELIVDEHIACGVYPIIKYVESVGDSYIDEQYAARDYSNL